MSKYIDEFDIIKKIGDVDFLDSLLWHIDNETLQELLEDISNDYYEELVEEFGDYEVITNNDRLEKVEEELNDLLNEELQDEEEEEV